MDTRDTNSVTATIVSKVAAEEEVGPLQLEPLHTAVDTDALQRLFNPPKAVNRIEFTYAGYTVIVEDRDDITLITF